MSNTQNDIEYWLRLILTPGLSCRKRLALLSFLGSPEAVLSASEAQLATILKADQILNLRTVATKTDWPELAAHINWLDQPGNFLITLADKHYPRSLLDLPDAPAAFFIKGHPDCLKKPSISIVGSRQATLQGVENAEAFSTALSQGGITIVSGLAVGIDAAAHRGGLAGGASTIAVVGTGLDRVYPVSNRQLAHHIVESGLMISEFPLGSPPRSEHFPRRNRLIAALGLGCLVVEATRNSGSLITARQSAELGREVFAIPGSIHSPQARGCHQLIKEGAKLVESAQDIYDELALPLRPNLIQTQESKNIPIRFQDTGKASAPLIHAASVPTGHGANTEIGKQRSQADQAVQNRTLKEGGYIPPLDPNISILLDCFGWDPIDIDTLVLHSMKTIEEINTELLELELAGQIIALPGGRFQRRL